ncbi:MAG: acyltransferase, partial [Nocardioides sp.]
MTRSAAPGRPMEFRPEIQGLRALAVLLVIGDHAGARWLPGGFVGVDVFFVISGYLITLLLVRQSDATGRVRIGEFYARRARRILPAASLVIVATMAYAAAEVSLSRVEQLREDLWSAGFAANIHFARTVTVRPRAPPRHGPRSRRAWPLPCVLRTRARR